MPSRVNCVTDPCRSPLLLPAAVRAFAQAPEGGRLFRLMCSIARRAMRLGYPVSAEEVASLALAVDDLIGPPKVRKDAVREAQNAINRIRMLADEVTP